MQMKQKCKNHRPEPAPRGDHGDPQHCLPGAAPRTHPREGLAVGTGPLLTTELGSFQVAQDQGPLRRQRAGDGPGRHTGGCGTPRRGSSPGAACSLGHADRPGPARPTERGLRKWGGVPGSGEAASPPNPDSDSVLCLWELPDPESRVTNRHPRPARKRWEGPRTPPGRRDFQAAGAGQGGLDKGAGGGACPGDRPAGPHGPQPPRPPVPRAARTFQHCPRRCPGGASPPPSQRGTLSRPASDSGDRPGAEGSPRLPGCGGLFRAPHTVSCSSSEVGTGLCRDVGRSAGRLRARGRGVGIPY